jgi:hypothetical protein
MIVAIASAIMITRKRNRSQKEARIGIAYAQYQDECANATIRAAPAISRITLC